MTYIPNEVDKNDPPDNRLLEVVLSEPVGTKTIPSRYNPKLIPSRYNPIGEKCDG
jgi:hypothetical protein